MFVVILNMLLSFTWYWRDRKRWFIYNKSIAICIILWAKHSQLRKLKTNRQMRGGKDVEGTEYINWLVCFIYEHFLHSFSFKIKRKKKKMKTESAWGCNRIPNKSKVIWLDKTLLQMEKCIKYACSRILWLINSLYMHNIAALSTQISQHTKKKQLENIRESICKTTDGWYY